ncbi:hypothetical protein FHS16_005544 [Paenibacillus endophyticus]|uniref:Uncharacterized protein n=1 Tax=Paenibacillus endophyticus TaxID=1294268 RepID=A0A7W5CCZ0_9BACL|nr:hypothetical protein [Paenibacillus endophyticus]
MEREEEICPSCAVYRIMQLSERYYNKECELQVGEYSACSDILGDSSQMVKCYMWVGACLSIIPRPVDF